MYKSTSQVSLKSSQSGNKKPSNRQSSAKSKKSFKTTHHTKNSIKLNEHSSGEIMKFDEVKIGGKYLKNVVSIATGEYDRYKNKTALD